MSVYKQMQQGSFLPVLFFAQNPGTLQCLLAVEEGVEILD